MPRSYTPALRQRLGLTDEQLPDGASDDQINAALRAPAGQRPRVAHDRGNRRPVEFTQDEREGLLLQAVEAGKFPASRAPHWRRQLIDDPRGTAQILAMLEPDPLRVERVAPGASGTHQRPESDHDVAYPAHWLRPEEQGGEMINAPVIPHNLEASSSLHADDGSGYTSTPPSEDDAAYPASWIGGKPTMQEGPIGFEDPNMRGLNGAGVQVDGDNAERRRTKAQT